MSADPRRGAALTRERWLEVGLAVVLVVTLAVAVASLRLPEAPVVPSSREAALREAPPETPEALDPVAALRDLWERIDLARDRGVICDGRPVPPVPRLAGAVPLDAAAYAQASFMAKTGIRDHATPGNPAGETPRRRIEQSRFRGELAGEVIAWGQATPEEVVRYWLGSPGDCLALMDPLATHGGASMVPDPESGGYVWVVVLGRKRQGF